MSEDVIGLRLQALGLELPPFNNAAANYAPVVRTGNLAFTAGQTTRFGGAMQYMGQVTEPTISEGYQGARLCALNCLGVLNGTLGSLGQIQQIVKITGFVNCASDFTKQAAVLDGATDLLVEIFGDAGRPARSAVGVSALPGNSMVEIEMIVALKEN